jgi:hypothetical protein
VAEAQQVLEPARLALAAFVASQVAVVLAQVSSVVVAEPVLASPVAGFWESLE